MSDRSKAESSPTTTSPNACVVVDPADLQLAILRLRKRQRLGKIVKLSVRVVVYSTLASIVFLVLFSGGRQRSGRSLRVLDDIRQLETAAQIPNAATSPVAPSGSSAVPSSAATVPQ